MADLYSEPLMLLHPRLAHSLLQDRLKQAKTLNEDLADYFKELHSIQEQHLRSLIKLSKRFSALDPPSQFRLDQDPLQIQSPDSLKSLLHQELLQLIQSHSNHQAQLQSQVEQPLRNSSSLGPSKQPKLKSLEELLIRMVKSYEDSELKLNRSSSKLGASVPSNPKKLQLLQARQSEDQAAFNQAKQLWSSQAPQIFKSYQSIDKDRLVDLFETLIKYETFQNDHYRQQLEISERSTISLVAFDIQEEMQRFALTTRSVSDQPTPPPEDQDQPRAPNDESTTDRLHQDLPSTSPTRSTPAPNHPPQSISQTTSPNQLNSSGPSGSSHSALGLSASPSQLQPSQLPAQLTQEEREQLPNQSAPMSPPRASDSPSTPPLQSSQIQPQARSEITSTYDPNHPEIPKLNAPNISVPIRSTPSSPANPSDSALPPRTLYVQSQNSIDSTSNQTPKLNSTDLSRSQRSTAQAPLSKTASHHSIAEKFFSRSRFVNILSRNNNHPQNHNLKSSQSRRLSQSNLSLDRGPPSEVNHPASLSHSIEMSRPRRSSSVMENPPSGNIYTEEPLKSPATSQTGSKSPWAASRFVPFLPGSNPLRKRKTSQSIPRMASSSVLAPKRTNQYAKTDSEGFTIPPENRDRTPWEQETDTEILSVDAADSSSHQPIGSRNNTTASHESQDSDRQSITGSGLNSFAIKPLAATETQDSEAERLAAIQKVQSTLASSFTSPLRHLSTTRRSNAALRGRRMEGRGVTMYDASPVSTIDPSTQHVRRGSVSDQPHTVGIHPADLFPPPLSRSTSDNAHNQLAQPFALSSSNVTQLRSPQSSADLHLQNDLTGRLSRSDSVNSTTFTSTGFHSMGPLLQVGATSGSKNPFFNTSVTSALSNNPSVVSTDQLTSSVNDEQALGSSNPKLMMISEKLNVLMHQGTLMKLLVIGEVHVTRLLVDRIGDKSDKLGFKIRHSDRLEKVAFPHGLVSPSSTRKNETSTGTDNNKDYELDLARFKALLLPDQRSFCILKYRLYFDCNQTSSEPSTMELAYRHLPVIIIPRWRTSKEKTELVLNYKLSAEYQKFQSDCKQELLSLSSSTQDFEAREDEKKQQVEEEIQNFELSTVIYNPDIDRTHTKKIKIKNQQSLPAGKFDSNTNQISWTLVGQEQGEKSQTTDKLNGKIVCRFFHDDQQDQNRNQNQNEGEGGAGAGAEGEKEKNENEGFVKENCGPIQVLCKLKNINLTGIQVEIDQLHLQQHNLINPSTSLNNNNNSHNNSDDNTNVSNISNGNGNNTIGLAADFNNNNNTLNYVEKIVQTCTFLAR